MNVNFRLSSCNVQTKLHKPRKPEGCTSCICGVYDGATGSVRGVSHSRLSNIQSMLGSSVEQPELLDGSLVPSMSSARSF